MKEQIDEKNCKDCLHFEACCKWTDFPKQVGFPVCRKYSKQNEGEWIWTESGQEDYEQYWVCSCCQEKDYFEDKFCPNCGAKMKGGE